MVTTLKTRMSQLTPEHQRRIEVETERLHQEYLTLQDLRKAKTLTQTQLAETLGIRQSTVAQMEKRSDLLISTLRSYIEAMGGRLDLVVAFPDRVPVNLGGLGEVQMAREPKGPANIPRTLESRTLRET